MSSENFGEGFYVWRNHHLDCLVRCGVLSLAGSPGLTPFVLRGVERSV